MVDPTIVQSIQPVTQASGMSFFRILSFSFLGIFIFLLLINTLYVAIEEKSIMPVLKNLGDTFLLSTEHISDISKEIVANDGGYIRSDDFWTGIWNYIKMYGMLYIYLYSIYCWFAILIWIYGHSPFSDTSLQFKNFFLALITFILLQSILLLAYAGVNKEVGCFYDCPKSAIYWIELPVTWIIDFLKALPLILKPANQMAHIVVGNSTI